jgi:hypothetical protein
MGVDWDAVPVSEQAIPDMKIKQAAMRNFEFVVIVPP